MSEYHTIYDSLTESGFIWVETDGPTSSTLRVNIIDTKGKYTCSFIAREEFNEWMAKQMKMLRDYSTETMERAARP